MDWRQRRDFLDFPAKIPYLNIIENFLGLLVRNFYRNGRLLDGLEDLENMKEDFWGFWQSFS